VNTVQKISIFGAIGPDTLERTRFQLEGFDRTLPLLVEVNSDGGFVSDGIAIFNLLRSWPSAVTVDVVGWALSIASLILMAGSTRRAHETASIMVHAPWTQTAGNSGAMRESAELLDQISQTMAVAYRKTGQKEPVIQSWLSGTDFWFTAADAKAAGLIHEVITDDAAQAVTPANAHASRHRVPTNFKRILAMPTPNPNPNANIEPGAAEQFRATIMAAETKRRGDIRAKFSSMMAREGVAALHAACDADINCSPQAAADRLLAHLGSQVTPIAGNWRAPDFSGDSRVADFKAAATDVLLARSGIKVADPHPGVRDLQRMSMVEIVARILDMTGQSPRDMSAAGVFASGMATDDFPALLSATAGKSLALGYGEAPSGHAQWTSDRDVKDFKQQTLVSLSEAPSLEKVAELGEYRNGSMSDGASTFKLATFGKILSISRQALINDDLASFTTLPASMGAAARRLEADMVYEQLTSNPVLADGFALFSAQHGNLGTAAALTVANLGLARAAMRKQKGIAGVSYLDPQPKFLVVPVALETTAEQLLASLVDPSRSNQTPNSEFIRGLTLIADPRLDVNSATAWYLAASPKQVETILRAYLAGQPRPYLEENTEFRVDSINWKVRLDFAAGVMDFRGLYKNPGA